MKIASPVGTFWYFSRAFDYVNREILLDTLQRQDIVGLPYCWIQFYLSKKDILREVNRIQKISGWVYHRALFWVQLYLYLIRALVLFLWKCMSGSAMRFHRKERLIPELNLEVNNISLLVNTVIKFHLVDNLNWQIHCVRYF